uniref:Uncharacterized protein n=1 Tax=Anguilla anguilla TaxID=7936 RepID=A0A0E9RM58_ANGAN
MENKMNEENINRLHLQLIVNVLKTF